MRSATRDASTVEEAGGSLLDYALDPSHWVVDGRHRASPAHLRVVDNVHICAGVDVDELLGTWVRVSFRGPELSPMKAADLLEVFVKGRFPFAPNVEWEVEIDSRRWIHFSRRYTTVALHA